MNECTEIILSDCAVICAAGDTDDLLLGVHRLPREVLRQDSTLIKDRTAYFGIVDLPEKYVDKHCSRTSSFLRCLSHRMTKSIERLRSRYDPERVAVIIASTTTGIREVISGKAIKKADYLRFQELSDVSRDFSNYLGFRGPDMVVSTACTSGAKALEVARRLLLSGICDAALVGGSESLNPLVCRGFDSLESCSSEISKPFQPDRDGINVGEGAALFTMEKGSRGVALAGFGESSDAMHESAPDAEGVQAIVAIKSALTDAGIEPGEVDYVNLHGTGTRLNDEMEAKAIHSVFGERTPVSSTKTVTGHTLGAAGSVEAAILWLLLDAPSSRLPPHHGADRRDQELARVNLLSDTDNPAFDVRSAMSTSFAFGGHNAALIMKRIDG